MSPDHFFDVPRTYYQTSHTRTQVPMFFRRLSMRLLNYFVDPSHTEPLLADTGLLPVRFANGKSVASLVFYDFEDVTIGPYQEVVLSIVVHPQARPAPHHPLITMIFGKRAERWGDLGTFVVEMPVTTPAARAAGREIWGYPKFLTRIPYQLEDRRFAFRVLEPRSGEPIVTVSGECGGGIGSKAFDFVSFTHYEDSIWRVVTRVDGKTRTCAVRSAEVEVGRLDHRMAHSLRQVGVEEAEPFAIVTADGVRSRLEAGTPIEPWKTPLLAYPHR